MGTIGIFGHHGHEGQLWHLARVDLKGLGRRAAVVIVVAVETRAFDAGNEPFGERTAARMTTGPCCVRPVWLGAMMTMI